MTEYVLQTGDNNPFDGIDVGFQTAPTFADIDGDGDLDLIVGEGDGDVNYYVNNGGTYTAATGANNPFDGINVESDNNPNGYRSTPAFADVDGDGDLDLIIGIVGDVDGYLNYYVNDGSGTYTESTGSANPFDGIGRFVPAGADDDGLGGASPTNSVPTFADIDGDGDLDLVIGKWGGYLHYYVNNDGTYTETTGSDNPFDGI